MSLWPVIEYTVLHLAKGDGKVTICIVALNFTFPMVDWQTVKKGDCGALQIIMGTLLTHKEEFPMYFTFYLLQLCMALFTSRFWFMSSVYTGKISQQVP